MKKSPNEKPAVVKVSSGDFWTPKKVGEKFCGVMTERHIAETRYGKKPFVSITDAETGETIQIVAGNVQLSPLNKYPLQTYVELEYRGKYKTRIGRKEIEVMDIVAYVDARVKAGDDWTAGKLDAKVKRASRK